MALIKCRECGTRISNKASNCPSCGVPIKSAKTSGCAKVLLFVFLMILLLVVISNILGNSKSTESTNSDKVDSSLAVRLRFEENIESVYDNLLKAATAGDDEGALAILQSFEKYNKMDYKDVSELKRKVRLNVNAKIINASSYTDVRTVYAAYVELAELEPTNKVYADKRDELKPKVDELDRIEKAQKAKADLAKKREEKIKAQFSGWDGSHYGLKKLIKASMHDPSSFEHVETKFGDKGDYLLVQTTYRGKNAFGALVLNSASVKADLEGNIIEIISED